MATTINSYDLKNSLDKLSDGNRSAKLIELYNILEKGGEITLSGFDLLEAARNLYFGVITSAEFIKLIQDSGNPSSMTDRIDELEGYGYEITYSSLLGMNYLIKAKK